MTLNQQPSSEPEWVTIADGSDRDWRSISMYELKQIEYAINEECVGRNDGCPPGHLKEMHDSGNEVIDKIRSRPYNPQEQDVKELFRKEIVKWKDEDPLFMAYVYGQEAEREKVLKILKSHIISVENELEKAYERDAGKWVGSNNTDNPRGKLDALKLLEKELRQNARTDWFGNYIHPKIITWCEA